MTISVTARFARGFFRSRPLRRSFRPMSRSFARRSRNGFFPQKAFMTTSRLGMGLGFGAALGVLIFGGGFGVLAIALCGLAVGMACDAHAGGYTKKIPTLFDFAKPEKKLNSITLNNKTREESINKLEELKQELKGSTSLLGEINEILDLLKKKKETQASLRQIHRKIVNIRKKAYSAHQDGKVENCDKLLGVLTPIYLKLIEDSSANVIDFQDSGTNKFPAKHSFFAATTQGTTTSYSPVPDSLDIENFFFYGQHEDYTKLKYGSSYSRVLADQIVNNKTIEKALLCAEGKHRGCPTIPSAPTHRLGEGVNIETQQDFEVLILKGTGKNKADTRTIDFDSRMISHALRNKHGDKCKGIKILNQPTPKELEQQLKELSEKLKGKKLYIFYLGHGNSHGTQSGVDFENSDKQGSDLFSFWIRNQGYNGLSETKIKELYNKYFADIEVVTVYDTCHSGAGIAGKVNKASLEQIGSLA